MSQGTQDWINRREKAHIEWDGRFLQMVDLIASWSTDRSQGVGAIITTRARPPVILSVAFNGFPIGVVEYTNARSLPPDKFLWTEHAERNAIYLAARTGVMIEGAKMRLDATPCMNCARAIIQSGIKEVIARPEEAIHFKQSKGLDPRDRTWALEMLKEGNVIVRFVQ